MGMWNLAKADAVVEGEKKGGNRCMERLAGLRCLLESGHEGNHVQREPETPSHDKEKA